MMPFIYVPFVRKVVIKRRSTGAYVDHVYVEDALPTDDFINGSVQPMTPKELKQEQQGETVSAAIKVYTSDVDKIAITDVIIDNGKSYRVFGITPWIYNGYIKVMAGVLDA